MDDSQLEQLVDELIGVCGDSPEEVRRLALEEGLKALSAQHKKKQRAPNAKLFPADVVEILQAAVLTREKYSSIAKRKNISVMTVANIVNRRSWRHIPWDPLNGVTHAGSVIDPKQIG
jgi:DNA invertase Pin-like site-specific DNA recombinase